jgi:hypothetical protein
MDSYTVKYRDNESNTQTCILPAVNPSHAKIRFLSKGLASLEAIKKVRLTTRTYNKKELHQKSVYEIK